MPTLQLTDQQVLDLLTQLPPEQQTALYRRLLAERWQTWEELSRRGQSGVRAAAAARGRDWDAMTDDVLMRTVHAMDSRVRHHRPDLGAALPAR